MLQWRLVLEEYGPNIEYITDEKNIAADALSRLPNIRNQETTYESKYTMIIFSELYNIEEMTEGTFTLYFKLIDRYQGEDPILTEKLTCAEYNYQDRRRSEERLSW